MQKVLSNSEMRKADEYTIKTLNIPSRTLMHRAGEGLFEEVLSAYEELGGEVLVVCGTGNNGGDGYVLARLLYEHKIPVAVYAVDGDLSLDCRREKEEYKGRYLRDIRAKIIVDCIFGTGLNREINGETKELITAVNSSGAYIISADIPSGINGDNGLVMGTAVKADKTVVISDYKYGHFMSDGGDYCGELIKKDIGISLNERDFSTIYELSDIKNLYPVRPRNSNKGTYGTANIIAGSERYLGAPVLAVETALKSGCGYVTLTACDRVKNNLCVKFPQVIYSDEPNLQADAIAIGMGCGVSEELYKRLKFLIENYRGVLILDADALNALAVYGVDVLDGANCEILITPHVKEFSRLTKKSVAEILANPIETAREFAKAHKITVLLKSSVSVITDGAATILNTRGTTALSKAGSGDMLAGYVCGFAATLQGTPQKAIKAAIVGAFTIGLAAEISTAQKTSVCATARDIIKNLPAAVKEILSAR